MADDGIVLRPDEKVAYLLQWGAFADGGEYATARERMLALPEADLDALYRFADYGPSEVEDVISEVLRDASIEIPLAAARAHHDAPYTHSFASVCRVIRALRALGVGMDHLAVHLRSYTRCTRIPSREHVPYDENLPLVALVEEKPDRALDIMATRIERLTDDAEAIRAAIEAPKPLSPGAL